jgi:hypothetical protein
MRDGTSAHTFGRVRSDFGELSEAEKALLECVRKGEECKFGNRPSAPDDTKKIRAGFIRFLALGGDKNNPIHEKGVQVRGAYITEDLDLSSCKGVLPISLRQSLIYGKIILRDAHTRTLDFDGSQIGKESNEPYGLAIDAAHATINGSIYFRQEFDGGQPREQFAVYGEVRFVGAEISGRLQCEGGKFSNPDGWALFFSRAKIAGGAFLGKDEKRKGSKPFEARGQVRFRGVDIGGNLECQKGRFLGKKNILEQGKGRKSLYCDGSKIGGHVRLSKGFIAIGEVDFLGADIGGEVECQGGIFSNRSEVALCFSNAKIGGSVHLGSDLLDPAYRFLAHGEVKMDGAEIGGSLKCERGRFCNPKTNRPSIWLDVADSESRALYFSGAKISGSALLNGARALGQVRFRNAAIGGTLECDNAKLRSAAGGYRALIFDHTRIEGVVRMRKLEAIGQVRFTSAETGGDLRLEGAKLRCMDENGSNPNWDMGGQALFFSRAKIEGSVFLSRGFSAKGGVRFRSARIGGTLVFNGAHLERNVSEGQEVLFFSNSTIAGNVIFNHDEDGNCFEATGEVRFAVAQINGNVNCSGASFLASKGPALVVAGAKIGGHVYLHNGFNSSGAVNFDHASIDGNVECFGGDFNANESSADALSFRSAAIKSALRLSREDKLSGEDKTSAIVGVLDLRDASVGSLVDNNMKCWPAKGNLKLDGFTYNRFAEGASYEASPRQRWLELQPPEDLGKNFKQQPFEQLVRVLRVAGHDQAARDIAIQKQWYLTQNARWFWRTWRSLLGMTVLYGYSPNRIFLATIVIWLICGGIYKVAEDQKIFAPTTAGYFLHKNIEACRAANKLNTAECYSENGPEYVAFHPLIFSLDVILPVVNLRQEDSWQPMHRPLKITIGADSYPLLDIRWITWLETLFGWLAAIMLTAFAGGVLKKE